MKETVYHHNNPDHLQASVLKNKFGKCARAGCYSSDINRNRPLSEDTWQEISVSLTRGVKGSKVRDVRIREL
jgi:hypothetical protein